MREICGRVSLVPNNRAARARSVSNLAHRAIRNYSIRLARKNWRVFRSMVSNIPQFPFKSEVVHGSFVGLALSIYAFQLQPYLPSIGMFISFPALLVRPTVRRTSPVSPILYDE